MGIASLVIGILTLIGAGIAFIPCLGWYNWINIVISAIGFILGFIGVFIEKEKGKSIAGIILTIIAIIVGIIRLVIGGGVI